MDAYHWLVVIWRSIKGPKICQKTRPNNSKTSESDKESEHFALLESSQSIGHYQIFHKIVLHTICLQEKQLQNHITIYFTISNEAQLLKQMCYTPGVLDQNLEKKIYFSFYDNSNQSVSTVNIFCIVLMKNKAFRGWDVSCHFSL